MDISVFSELFNFASSLELFGDTTFLASRDHLGGRPSPPVCKSGWRLQGKIFDLLGNMRSIEHNRYIRGYSNITSALLGVVRHPLPNVIICSH